MKQNKKDFKLTKQEVNDLKFAEDNLERKKEVYETFLKVLIKYGLSDLAYSAIATDELYHENLLKLIKNNKGNQKSISELMFGESIETKLTEIEKLKKEEEYYDKLIKLAENKISGLPYEAKMKIAKDSMRKMNAWIELPCFEFKNIKTKNKK